MEHKIIIVNNDYKEFQRRYDLYLKDNELIKSLYNNLEIRFSNLCKDIAYSFSAFEGEENEYIEISDQNVYDLLYKNKKFEIIPFNKFDLSGITIDRLISHIKNKYLTNDSNDGLILIKLELSKNYIGLLNLQQEINSIKEMLDSKVIINIIRSDQSRNFINSGLLIFIHNWKSVILEEPKIYEEVILDGVSSKDKKKFVSALVNRYIKDHPDLTFEELKKNLSPLHNERKIINDLYSIKKWKEDGHKEVWSGETFVSKDGIRFKVYNQWKENFKKVIDFAKTNNYI